MRQQESHPPFRAERFIPHRPPMLLVDAVGFENGVPTAYAEVKADWAVLDQRGRLSGAAFFEIMAQGYACIQGMQAWLEDGQTAPDGRLGFLVGVKRLQLAGSAGVGDRLCVTTDGLSSIGPFHVFDAFVRASDGTRLAGGQLKVFLTDKAALRAGITNQAT